MKSALLTVLTVVGMTLASGSAQAFGHRGGCGSSCAPACAPACAPVCAPQVTWVEKTVTCYRPVVREKQVTVQCNRIVTREVVTPVTRTVMVPEMKTEQRTIWVCHLVPKQVEREITCVKYMPCATPAPACGGCGGCGAGCGTGCNICQTMVPVTTTQKIVCTIMENQPIEQKITVPVCTYKAVQETVQCRQLVCETVPENVVRTVRYCELEAYQTTVRVPVCTPAPACNTCASCN
jgi:hypothetical protein